MSAAPPANSNGATAVPSARVLDHLGLRLDRVEHQAYVRHSRLALTPTEFRLLECFLTHPGRAFSRQELVAAAIGADTVVQERTIDVHIKALRRKLGDAGPAIETVRGVGYRFRS